MQFVQKLHNHFPYLLQPALQLGLMTNECFNKLIVHRDLAHTACLKSTVSKTLGVGIVAGSSMVKLPQVCCSKYDD